MSGAGRSRSIRMNFGPVCGPSRATSARGPRVLGWPDVLSGRPTVKCAHEDDFCGDLCSGRRCRSRGMWGGFSVAGKASGSGTRPRGRSVRSATAGSSRAVLAMRQADNEPGTPEIRFVSQVAMGEWKPVVPLLRGAVFTAAVLRLAGGCAGVVLALLAFTGFGNPTTESALLLENVTVIDGTGAPAQAGMSVVVAGERIAAVGAVDSVRAIIPPGAETVDASGQFLIPGLWDMHVHLGGLDG